jgi:hypothetical protein
MAKSTFQGPVKSLSGLISAGPGGAVTLTTSTQLTVDDHAGRIIRVNGAAITLTLPLINAVAANSADGPGFAPAGLNNQGATFRFFIQTASTALIITTSGTTDKLYGSVFTGIDNAATGKSFFPAATNAVITLNGTTAGGLVGSYIELTVLSALAYMVKGTLNGSGTLITPFSDS